MMGNPVLSIIVPCYDEESNAMPFYEAIERLFPEPGILSDDGSRNFGKETVLFAGLRRTASPPCSSSCCSDSAE